MAAVKLEEVTEVKAVDALKGPGTNALVHNPFTFEEVTEVKAVDALKGPGTNALVHNPFAWGA